MTIFTPKYINVTTNPTIIIGEKPNTTRDNSIFSLQGNRTGDFVSEAIEDLPNIILTNVVNVLYKGDFDRSHPSLADGINDLIEMFEKYQPAKIICLGTIAKDYVDSIRVNCPVIHFPHPSRINRFKSGERNDYIKSLRDEINKRIPVNTSVGN